jgi:hypothetical protein
MRRLVALTLLLLLLAPALVVLPQASAGHSGSASDALDRRTAAVNGFGGSSYPTGLSWDNDTGTSSTIQSSQAKSGDSACTANHVLFSIDFMLTDTEKEPRAVNSISVDAQNTGSGGGTSACLRVYGIRADASAVELGIMGNWPIGNPAPRQTYSISFENQDYVRLDFYLTQRQASPAANLGLAIYEVTAPGIPNTPPLAPAGLSATANGCLINVGWTPDEDTHTTGYKVYRATSAGGLYTLLTTIASRTAGGYTDMDVVTDDTRHYKVSAYSPDGEGPQAGPVNAQAGICDGSGLGSVGADSHVGPNELTHKAPDVNYTGQGQWTLGAFGSRLNGCTHTGTLAERPLACATDGVPSTYVNLGTPASEPAVAQCSWSTGYITWDFNGEARKLQNWYLRAETYNVDYNGGSGCISIAYKHYGGDWIPVKTWNSIVHNTGAADYWFNDTSAPVTYGVRVYVGDTLNAGRYGLVLYEADVYHANATKYDPTSSLRDLAARYSAKIGGTFSYGDFRTHPFTLSNGVWKVVMPVPYDVTTGRYYNWVFEATGGGFTAVTESIGPRIPGWEESDATPDCAVGIYKVIVSGGSRAVTARAPGTNSGTTFCRITGTSFMPSPYQPTSQGYKIQADWSARTCGGVPCAAFETAGMYYQATGFPWSPMIDGDFTAENLKAENFTIGSVLMGAGAPGTRAVLSLAKYPFQFFGNGLFIGLAQEDAANSGALESTNFEILLNGRPASIVWQGDLGGYEYAIFYLDDQAARRGVANTMGDQLQGNRREHGFVPETYEIEILKGFDPAKPVRVVRSVGFEGHSGITCRDFCSGNVDLTFYKTPYNNSNEISWTVTDANGTRLQGARLTDNRTGAFSFTNAQGQVVMTDVYQDTKFTFTLAGYYAKCVGFVYQSLEGQQVTTKAEPCGSSESYPEVRAQNLAYTVILYPLYVAPPSSTEFNEVPVDFVDAPTQGVVFRSQNLTRITPDGVTIQVQRNISEDLVVTVMRFDPKTGTLSRVSTPYVWSRMSTANPLMVTYPAGGSSTAAHHGSYHLMIQRGDQYLTGVSFKITTSWEAQGTIPLVTNPDETGVGNDAASENLQNIREDEETRHDNALKDSLSKVDLGGTTSFAVVWIPVILFIFFAALVMRNWH